MASYVYFEDKRDHLSAPKLPSKDEARRIAANIAKLVAGETIRARRIAVNMKEPLTSILK